MIVKDDRAHQVSVETGIRQGDRVQITKGLSGGETVIASGAYGLPDNTKVKIADATPPANAGKSDSSPNATREGISERERLKSWIQPFASTGPSDERYWFTRYSKSLVFLILVLCWPEFILPSPFRFRFFPRPIFRAS